jgi:hypothetical protein
MMSPHTHVALTKIRDEEEARRAARRPDAVHDPEPQREEAASPPRMRHLARLHLTPARHA